MPTPPNSHGEHPSTYMVEDRFSKDELSRLMVQEQMATKGMGGVWPEQPDPTLFRRVLDVACGPGGWLLAAAQAYPTLSELVGVDVNARLIAYARQQAETRQISNRVQFLQMDALHLLDFPNEHFDLVNQRSATSYLRTWDWSKLLNEMKRVTRVGGVVRLTEPNVMPDSTSPAFNHIADLMTEAVYQSGHLYRADKNSISDQLPDLMRRYGFLNVETRDHTIEYRAGTPEGDLALEDTRIGLHTLSPFLHKWARVHDDFAEISQRALTEMQQPGFVATWFIRTIWGIVPTNAPALSQPG